MNYRSPNYSSCLLPVVAFALLTFGPSLQLGQAQQITTLIQFTNAWKFDQSGLEPGTAWRTNDFDDSAWPTGAGLLGIETGN